MNERHPFPMGHPRPEFLRPERFEQAGTDPILWAVFGLAITLLALLVLALAVMVAGRRRPWHVPGPPLLAGGPLEALELVRMRYARGKMSREEYLQASADLGAPPAESEKPPPARRRR